jgi:predicted ATPase
LLRRVRETTDNELSEGKLPVKNSDISILYIEPTEEGVNVKKIDIDDDGEFIGKWPHGFFGERRRELF